MAFLKYADAIVNNPKLNSPKQWNKVRVAASSPSIQAVPVANILSDFSPDQYLLTHATIVASVDVENNDYHIKPECSKYVNQNGDSWERRLLLSTFHTFIGAQNYLEHIQIPHLSKGRIIDAVARSVNDDESIYIDILVATSREHADLVASIENGTLNTLSMGCSIKFSICSKCGNKAVDETELCDHIKYMKNQFFVDENGTQRIIAELCGHRDEPESNVFIEASWVANPAFKGAVLRNIIVAKDDAETAKKIEKAYVSRKADTSIDGYLKAASMGQIETLIKKISSAIRSKKADEPSMLFDDDSASDPALPPDPAPEAPAEPVPAEPAPEAPAPEAPAPAPAPEAPAPAEPASLEDLIEGVKNNIRQQIMEELSKEVQNMVSPNEKSYLNMDKNRPSLDMNNNLVKAFVQEYKTHTGWSSARLASVCQMLVAHTHSKKIAEFANNRRDAIDFFEFMDKFTQGGLTTEHYNVLRRASSEAFSSAENFVEYVKSAGLRDTGIIKKVLERASILKVLDDSY